MSFSPALAAYRAATSVVGAFAGLWLGARADKGKEDKARLGERFGRYIRDRPAGTLIWLHAASVGESGVALGLIEAMSVRDPSLSFLLSTGTRTSADLVARRALPRVTHIYAPLDRGSVVRRFLDHWRPDLGVFVESEIWPNLILAAEARRVPLALVNARMSPNSLQRWRDWPKAGARLLRAFAFVSAADTRTSAALTEVRGESVPALGNLKLAAPALRVDANTRAALAQEIGARPFWLAASTHLGEDEIALAAHALIRAESPDALLVIAPRHPERGAAIATRADNAPRRSKAEPIGHAPVYIADTLGELGLFYDLAPTALVAGSLRPDLKGHNPIEPAKLDAAIVSGPHVESFQDLFDALTAAGGVTTVNDAASIANAVTRLWSDEAARSAQIAAARGVIAHGVEAFDATVTQLIALLPQGADVRPAHATA
ncbi:3-deoxy-D-manno-octulosonic acid transferase [Terricaulis silvestris]|uniref:3-deoxy-D-manno-octulosonic acid transferase n=1 Tax=Terricaulis silvestris TaxID=2686094 RepID=A0A6I6MS45_9CAUL|nr:3-deoxy-D-manno-octulosonic acid transferase [Terricaulis silvestris]QGZ94492.1 3-deoxy-D-manno-octulosonic acid transferase [Terricaulis silvestris]